MNILTCLTAVSIAAPFGALVIACIVMRRRYASRVMRRRYASRVMWPVLAYYGVASVIRIVLWVPAPSGSPIPWALNSLMRLLVVAMGPALACWMLLVLEDIYDNRLPAGSCQECGYRIDNLPGPNCPECGTRFAEGCAPA